jgi:hypothetical protein
MRRWGRRAASAEIPRDRQAVPEVAVEVIRPFVGEAIPEAGLSRLAREAYDTFRHPAGA